MGCRRDARRFEDWNRARRVASLVCTLAIVIVLREAIVRACNCPAAVVLEVLVDTTGGNDAAADTSKSPSETSAVVLCGRGASARATTCSRLHEILVPKYE